MRFLFQYQGYVEPLWTESVTVDLDWHREPEYPVGHLVPPRWTDSGFQHDPLQDIAAVDPEAGWLIDNQYPVAYLEPPRPVGVGYSYVPQALELPFDIDWFPGPEYPVAYLIPPPREQGWLAFLGEPSDWPSAVAWGYRRGGFIVPAPGKPRRLSVHNVRGHR